MDATTTTAPLVSLVVETTHGTRAVMADLCHQISCHLGKQERFHLLVDTSKLTKIDFMALYKDVLVFLKLNRERIGMFIVSSSIIVSNVLVRKLLTSVFKVYKPVSPLKIVDTQEDALQFLGSESY